MVSRIIAAAWLLSVGSAFAPAFGLAALGDCSQPVTNGAGPTATDCLHILQASVGLASCSPECICAPKGSLPIAATDALICLAAAVGQSPALSCPCGTTTTTVGGGTTTTLAGTTTTLGGGTTTSTTLGGATTTTTTTSMPSGGVTCSIDVSACTSEACTCGDLPGADYRLTANGQMSGPVGTEVRINVNALQGGDIDCGAWSRVFGSEVTGCDLIGCCKREGGQPGSTQWVAIQAIEIPCICPPQPGLFLHNYLVQCQLPPGPVTEHEQTTTPCS